MDKPDESDKPRTTGRTETGTPLLLRRASVSRKGGDWQHEDYDVFDGIRVVGRVYLVDAFDGKEIWFWGVSFQLTGRKSYGRADSLDGAKAAFRAEYEKWKAGGG